MPSWTTRANRGLARFGMKFTRDDRPTIARRNLLNRALAPVGWQIRRTSRPRSTPARPLTFYEGVLTGLLAARGHLNIVQVGANDGRLNDPIYRWVNDHATATSVVLCEPQPEVLDPLRENYADHPRAAIFAGAVSSRSEPLVLHRIHPDHWDGLFADAAGRRPTYRQPSGKATADRDQARRYARRHVRDDVDVDTILEAITVETCDLDGVLARTGLFTRVDVLQVDTEGFDDDVVYASVTDTRRPEVINFEIMWLDDPRREALLAFLTDHGYRFVEWTHGDMLAWRAPDPWPPVADG